MNFKELIDRHKEMLEYTEEPDAFETQTEREMQKELERDIDKSYIAQEKENKKYIDIVEAILNSNKVNYYREDKKIFCYFPTKISYKTFIAKEGNSKRLNDCLLMDLDENKKFEELSYDPADKLRYLVLWVK